MSFPEAVFPFFRIGLKILIKDAPEVSPDLTMPDEICVLIIKSGSSLLNKRIKSNAVKLNFADVDNMVSAGIKLCVSKGYCNKLK